MFHITIRFLRMTLSVLHETLNILRVTLCVVRVTLCVLHVTLLSSLLFCPCSLSGLLLPGHHGGPDLPVPLDSEHLCG